MLQLALQPRPQRSTRYCLRILPPLCFNILLWSRSRCPSVHHQLPPVTAPHSQTTGHLPCTPCHLTTDLQQLCQVCLQRRPSIPLLTHGFKDTLKHRTEEENYQRPPTVNQPLHPSASHQAFCSHSNPLWKGSCALSCKNFTGFSTHKATEYLEAIPPGQPLHPKD